MERFIVVLLAQLATFGSVWLGAWLFNPPITSNAVWFIAWIVAAVEGGLARISWNQENKWS